jgi:hypothetical protein
MSAVLLLTASLMITPQQDVAQSNLSGVVSNEEGTPVAGATVFVYTAAPRRGAGVLCPSCYSDCRKHAVSQEDGRFSIESLDPQLLFRVLFVAEGLDPAFLEQVDPSAGPVSIKLKRRHVPDDPRCVVRGRVVDQVGNPVVGALVEPFGCKNEQGRRLGGIPGVDPKAITNLAGEFLITAEQPAIAFDLRVRAREFAPRLFALAPTGEKPLQLELTPGTTVIGRVLKDGKPLVGAAIGLIQVDRQIVDMRIGPNGTFAGFDGTGPLPVRGFVGSYEIATDERGEFMFRSVVANEDMYVYGVMNSLKDQGAIVAKKIRSGTEAGTDAGDLIIESGYRLSGRVSLEGGEPVPAGTRVIITRLNVADGQLVEVNPDGTFVAKGLPTDVYFVNVGVSGYRLSNKNRSKDRLSTGLKGLINSDTTEINILMSPGDPQLQSVAALPPGERAEIARSTLELQTRRLQGTEP